MKICVFGAGAIGGYLAVHLAQVDGVEVSVVARGEHLAAIRTDGLKLVSPRGELQARVRATDRPEELGPQDVPDALAARLGVAKMPLSIDERIAAARNAGDHKMSLLQDLERGRPEIDVLVDCVGAGG